MTDAALPAVEATGRESEDSVNVVDSLVVTEALLRGGLRRRAAVVPLWEMQYSNSSLSTSVEQEVGF